MQRYYYCDGSLEENPDGDWVLYSDCAAEIEGLREQVQTLLKAERPKLEARLKELDAKIAAHPHWGAVLTAMEEERRGILAALIMACRPE
jgi:hypothetical protein